MRFDGPDGHSRRQQQHPYAISILLLLVLGILAFPVFAQPSQEGEGQDVPSDNPAVTTSKMPSVTRVHLKMPERERRSLLYTPSSYTGKPMPLLLVFHGYLGAGHQMMRNTRFNQLAEKEGFLVLYPETIRIRSKWEANLGPSESSEEDVQFVLALIDYMKQSRNIDPDRIYATGFSSGGFLSHRLACDDRVPLAAIATVASTIGKPVMQTCNQKRPMPVLLINGTSDPIITWKGKIRKVRHAFKDAKIASVPQTLAFWKAYNGCLEAPGKVTLQIHASTGSTGIQVNEYDACMAMMKQVIVQKGGHTWPGSDLGPKPVRDLIRQPVLGRTSREMDASSVIWDFLKQQTRQPIENQCQKIIPGEETSSLPLDFQ